MCRAQNLKDIFKKKENAEPIVKTNTEVSVILEALCGQSKRFIFS